MLSGIAASSCFYFPSPTGPFQPKVAYLLMITAAEIKLKHLLSHRLYIILSTEVSTDPQPSSRSLLVGRLQARNTVGISFGKSCLPHVHIGAQGYMVTTSIIFWNREWMMVLVRKNEWLCYNKHRQMFGVVAEWERIKGQWKNLRLKNKQANTAGASKQSHSMAQAAHDRVLYCVCLIVALTMTPRLALPSYNQLISLLRPST